MTKRRRENGNGEDPPVTSPETVDVATLASAVQALAANQKALMTALTELRDQTDANFQKLPKLVDLSVAQRLEQQPQPDAAMTQGETPQAAAMPAMKGKLGELMQLAPLFQMFASQQPKDQFGALAESLKGVAALFQVVDSIRGGASGPALGANPALRWMQFGWELGAKGNPKPDFPIQGQHVPPSQEIGG